MVHVVSAEAQSVPEEQDAAAAFSQLGESGPVQRVRAYLSISRHRLGVVRRDGRLYVLAGRQNESGWRSRVRELRGADATRVSPYELSVEIVSEQERIFAVKFVLTPPPPSDERCRCTPPGETYKVHWFRFRESGALQPILEFDLERGFASWNEADGTTTLVQVHGPMVCPPGCAPVPAHRVVYQYVYRLGDALEVVWEDRRDYAD